MVLVSDAYNSMNVICVGKSSHKYDKHSNNVSYDRNEGNEF